MSVWFLLFLYSVTFYMPFGLYKYIPIKDYSYLLKMSGTYFPHVVFPFWPFTFIKIDI